MRSTIVSFSVLLVLSGVLVACNQGANVGSSTQASGATPPADKNSQKDGRDETTPAAGNGSANSAPSSNAVIDPSTWKNSYKAVNGVIWSDILPAGWGGGYANCITKKDDQGNPLPGATANCEYDSGGHLLGTSGLTVTDSDAVQACKAIGGLLPSQQDFENLGEEYKNLPNFSHEFLTSTVVADDPEDDCEAFMGDANGQFAIAPRYFFQYSVRCIANP